MNLSNQGKNKGVRNSNKWISSMACHQWGSIFISFQETYKLGRTNKSFRKMGVIMPHWQPPNSPGPSTKHHLVQL